MKLYLFYLCNLDLIRSTREKVEQRDRFYLIEKEFNDLMRIELDNGHDYILYAMTDNKKYAETFEKTHNMKLFIKLTKKISREDYHKSAVANNYADLKEYKARKSRNESVYLILTTLEEEVLLSYKSEIEFKFITLPQIEYRGYKEKYVLALDKILYCTFYITKLEGDPISSFEYFNWGTTVESTFPNEIGFEINDVVVYEEIFELILRKDWYLNYESVEVL